MLQAREADDERHAHTDDAEDEANDEEEDADKGDAVGTAYAEVHMTTEGTRRAMNKRRTRARHLTKLKRRTGAIIRTSTHSRTRTRTVQRTRPTAINRTSAMTMQRGRRTGQRAEARPRHRRRQRARLGHLPNKMNITSKGNGQILRRQVGQCKGCMEDTQRTRQRQRTRAM